MSAATTVSGSMFPEEFGGQTTTIRFTPATLAGVTDMMAELGYLAAPPGT